MKKKSLLFIIALASLSFSLLVITQGNKSIESVLAEDSSIPWSCRKVDPNGVSAGEERNCSGCDIERKKYDWANSYDCTPMPPPS